LVDDEKALAITMCEALGNEYEIELAGDAAEALRLLGLRQFDLILSDHMMPGKMQGLSLLAEAMELQPRAKRILLTGYLNPELLSRAVSLAQLSACLIKPIELARLRQELRNALRS
jgi:CheY-like chemotaxis protein